MAASSSAAAPARVDVRAPQIEITEVGESTMSFVLSGTDTSVANALRRSMIAETPCLAIDRVEIEDNTSALHDEFLAHRLGLIPLRFLDVERDITTVFAMDDPDAEAVDEVLIILDVQNEGEAVRVVTSRDLEVVPLAEHHALVEPAHAASREEAEKLAAIGADDDGAGAVAPEDDVDGAIAIVKLGPWQRVRLRAYANLGWGKIHARYIPVSTVVMRYEHVVEVNAAAMERLRPDDRRAFVEACQVGVLDYVEDGATVRVRSADALTNPTELKRLAAAISPDGEPLVRVERREGRFLFDVETTGAITATQAVRGGMGALIRKLETIRHAVAAAAGTGGGHVEPDDGGGAAFDGGAAAMGGGAAFGGQGV